MLRELRSARPILGLALAAVVFTHSPCTLAQTDEQRAAARSLATEGATAFNESRWKDAVDLFSRAEALVHAPPHLLFLARAHDKLGQVVKAREAYLKITKEVLAPTAPQAFRDAQRTAEQELKAVEPRIASLTIKVQAPPNATDVSVAVDGEPVPQVLVGVARPIDPGEHKVEAVASGFRARPETVRLADGERKAVTLALVADPTVVSSGGAAPPFGAEPAGAVAPTASSLPGSPPPATPEKDDNSGLRIGSYAAFGVGAVGLGLGTLFLLRSSSKQSDADAAFDACTATGDCRTNDPSAVRTRELDDDARSALTVSIVGFSVGAVGVGVGAALFLMSGNSTEERPPTGFSLRPYVGLDRAGVYGSF